MLDDLFDYCFPILDKIGHKLDSIEDDMFEGRAEDVVRDLSERQAGDHLLPQDHQARARRPCACSSGASSGSCPRSSSSTSTTSSTRAERIWDLLDNYKEVVEALESTNESVISHRQNDVLRVLTVFSAILLPLTLITGIFGMNVDFPGSGTAAAFWVIAAFYVVVGASLIGFFRWKRWL